MKKNLTDEGKHQRIHRKSMETAGKHRDESQLSKVGNANQQ